MKWNYQLSLLLGLMLVSVCIAKDLHKKETQQSKKQEKLNHKQSSLGHWDVSVHSSKPKSEHHAVKEVQKHAPFSVSHHEARTQLDLGHGKKKPLHATVATKSELKMQDLIHEDAVHHKIQAHKLKNKHDEHGLRHVTEEPVKRTNGHHQGSSHEKRERKPPKKVLLNKMKKNKRAKRLHKQFLF
ncbi:hypothetical protein CHUAL_009122 [Chamberlinius hualienensis]